MKKSTLIIALIAFASFAIAQTVQRIPLHEVFTSATCGPCVQGNGTLDPILSNSPGGFSNIKYQVNWPGNGDPYYTSEVGARRNYYSVTGVPDMFVDGTFNIDPRNYSAGALTSSQSVTSFLEIIATYDLNVGNQTVDVDVSIDANTNYNSNSLRCHIAIVEKTTFNNSSQTPNQSNGETEFHYVMKKLLPNAGGTSIPALAPGPPIQVIESFTFQGSYRKPNNALDPINHNIEHSVEEFTDLAVVVWVQDNADKQVINSTMATSPVGIPSLDKSGSGMIGLYPNPAVTSAELHYNVHGSHNVEITVYNILGEVVFSENRGMLSHSAYSTKFNVEEWTSGIYIVKLAVDEEVYTKKLNVYR